LPPPEPPGTKRRRPVAVVEAPADKAEKVAPAGDDEKPASPDKGNEKK
jgi:hypothetical protein